MAIFDVVGAVFEKILDKFPDPIKKQELALELFKLKQAGEFKEIDVELESMKQQAAINAIEAQNPSLLVSGGRPLIIWVCGIGLALQFIINPILTWGYLLYTGKPLNFPNLEIEMLLSLLAPILGLGGYRMLEKKWKVARN